MSLILYYLIIGLVFAAFIDYTRDSIESKWPSLLRDEEPFDAWQRFFMVVLWPLCLIVFLSAFCKTYFKK